MAKMHGKTPEKRRDRLLYMVELSYTHDLFPERCPMLGDLDYMVLSRDGSRRDLVFFYSKDKRVWA